MDLCQKFPYIKDRFDAYLQKNGYKSDYNCYCVHAQTLLEDPDRLIHILQPLIADQKPSQVKEEDNKDFSSLMNQLKEIYGDKYPALEKKN